MHIGDHEADTHFGTWPSRPLGGRAFKVVAFVAAGYSRSEPEKWQTKPDYIASNVGWFMIIGKYA